MEKDKANKAMTPADEKPEALVEKKMETGKPSRVMRIKFRPNRGAEGVEVDSNNEANVDSEMAAYLIGIGYADEVKEK